MNAIKTSSLIFNTYKTAIVSAMAEKYNLPADEVLAFLDEKALPPTEHKCCQVTDITTFHKKSTRSKNDATNAIRERVLTVISDPPPDFLAHPEHGKAWINLHREWTAVLKKSPKKRIFLRIHATKLRYAVDENIITTPM